MRGQRDIRLFCRHASKPSRLSGPAKRWYSPKSDLDAADSNIVRKAEHWTEDEHAQQLPSNISRKVPSRLTTESSLWMSKHRRLTIKTECVTPPDLLQYALLGEPSTHTNATHYLRIVFRQRGVSSKADASEKIQHLTRDFTTNFGETLKAAGYSANRTWLEKAAGDIYSCTDIRILERILTILSTTRKGCGFIAWKGKVVVRAIKKCRETLNNKPQHLKTHISTVLGILNNLTQAMTSKGTKIEEALCAAGLYYASEVSILPAVRMYLEIAHRNGYALNRMFEGAVQKLQFDYVKENYASIRWAPWKGKATRREELLKLITGWNSEEVSCSDFLSTADKGIGGLGPYSSYIVGLGEMGFSNALWEEWQSRANSMLLQQRFKGQLFAMAFVLAKDPARALEVLDTIPADEPVSQARIQIRTKIIEHYKFHRLKHSQELFKMVDKGIPTDPSKALETFEKLLLVNFPKFIPSSPLNLDWGIRGKEEGLLVMPTMGKHHIYFKSSGTRIRGERK